MASINKFYSALKKSLSKNKNDEDDDNPGSSIDRWNGWNDGKMIDDCVGVLLSYLSLKDKFRLESVSRQWKRKIFWSIGYLIVSLDESGNCYVGDFNQREILKNVNADNLKKILKKCSNIKCVELDIGSPNHSLCHQILFVIANDCTYLSHLKIFSSSVCDKEVEMMMLKMEEDFPNLYINGANKLKKLEKLNENYGLKLFSICVNLEELQLGYVSLRELSVIDFPKLTTFKAIIYIEYVMTPEFTSFCDRHANRLERINLTFKGRLKKKELMCAFIEINKLVKLEFISIYLWNGTLFDVIKIEHFFTFSSSELNQLKRLTVWNKLKKLSIKNYDSIQQYIPSNLIYQSFIEPFLCVSDFNLESLDFRYHDFAFSGSIKDAFQVVMPNLKKLKLNVHVTLDGFYNDLHLYVPNLTKLSLYSRKYSANENKLVEIEKLSQLEKLKIWFESCEEKGVIQDFITNYSSSMIGHKSLRMVKLNCSFDYYGIYLKSKDIRQLCAFASTIPSIRFKFFASSISLDKSVFQMWIELSQIAMPKNLDIYIEDKNPFILNGTIMI